MVPAATTPATLKAFGPTSVVTGGTASVGITWNVPAGNRYLGLVEYRQTAADTVLLGNSTVLIDASAALPAAAQAPLLKDKPVN